MTMDLILAIGMLGAAAMAWGGTRMITKYKDQRKGLLMITVALVILANVLIIAWPQ